MIITNSIWNVLIIFRSYIDAQGKKKVNFSEKLNSKMSERPKSPVIKDMQHYILPKIEESFKSYIIVSIHANFFKIEKKLVFFLKKVSLLKSLTFFVKIYVWRFLYWFVNEHRKKPMNMGWNPGSLPICHRQSCLYAWEQMPRLWAEHGKRVVRAR